MRSPARKDEVGLEHLAGFRIVPAGFERDHAKTQRSQELNHFADQRFVLVDGKKRGLELDQRKALKDMKSALENFHLITLGVDLEIGRLTRTDRLREYIIQAATLDPLAGDRGDRGLYLDGAFAHRQKRAAMR